MTVGYLIQLAEVAQYFHDQAKAMGRSAKLSEGGRKVRKKAAFLIRYYRAQFDRHVREERAKRRERGMREALVVYVSVSQVPQGTRYSIPFASV
jgi:hypothetical protein